MCAQAPAPAPIPAESASFHRLCNTDRLTNQVCIHRVRVRREPQCADASKAQGAICQHVLKYIVLLVPNKLIIGAELGYARTHAGLFKDDRQICMLAV